MAASTLRRDLAGLGLWCALCLGVSGLGALATASSVTTWYAELSKPSFTPPNGVFAPVWTTLYLMIAAAAVEIVALLAAIVFTAWQFWRSDRIAGLLLLPYAAWVAFASALTIAIWRLN